MWQRFTERARKVVFYAQEEAQALHVQYVAPEHLLLGLCRESDSSAARILNRLGTSLVRVRAELEEYLHEEEGEYSANMTLTPGAKLVIDRAYDEARNLNNNYIGSEHILLALIRDETTQAGLALKRLGVEIGPARKVTIELQDQPDRSHPNPSPPPPTSTSTDYENRSVSVMAMMLMLRQRRGTVESLAIAVLSSEDPKIEAVFRKLGLIHSSFVRSLDAYLQESILDSETDEAGWIADILVKASEEAVLASQPLAPRHFIPAIFQLGNNKVEIVLKKWGISLEGIRSAIVEVGA